MEKNGQSLTLKSLLDFGSDLVNVCQCKGIDPDQPALMVTDLQDSPLALRLFHSSDAFAQDYVLFLHDLTCNPLQKSDQF